MTSKQAWRRGCASIAIAAGFALTPAVADAATATFDFEELPTNTPNCFTGGVPSVASTKSGLTATFTRDGGGSVGIVDLSGFASSSNGSRSLCGVPVLSSTQALLADFSAPVDSVSIEFGDLEPSDDDVGVLEAYSGPGGTGTLLASDTKPQPNGSGYVLVVLSTSATGIASIKFNSGSPEFPNSGYWDNLIAQFGAPPEADLCFGQPATITGNGTVTGTEGDDVIITGNGNDIVDGKGGNDRICTRGGDDHARGGAGNDRLNSGNGNDNTGGQSGNDIVQSTGGNDDVQGGDGMDHVTGGEGNDTLNGGNDVDAVEGEGGNDLVAGNAGSPDYCDGGTGTDATPANGGCETIVGIP
jgi:hypothetical protein